MVLSSTFHRLINQLSLEYVSQSQTNYKLGPPNFTPDETLLNGAPQHRSTGTPYSGKRTAFILLRMWITYDEVEAVL